MGDVMMTDTDPLRQQMAYALRDRLLTPTAGPTQWGFHLADAVLPIVTAWAEREQDALLSASQNLLNTLDGITVGRKPKALEDAMHHLRAIVADTAGDLTAEDSAYISDTKEQSHGEVL